MVEVKMIEHYKKYEPLFGAWEISKLIGKGSFGEVYEIERNNFGIVYKAALKAITIPFDESELNELMASGMSMAETKQYIKQSAKDIVNEFVLMSQLKGNTNIVSYEDHQVIEHEDKLGWDILMKMELLEPLNKYMKSKDFTQRELVKLGIDLCTALELCEKHNIVHRDIKPENIFVSPNGDFKLGDFGIARSIEKATLGMSKKGTYTYMAPEVYKGEDYTTSVDIYSLGIVMYKLLNHNRVPFMPKYPAAIAYTDRENALMKRMNGEKLPLPDCEQAAGLVTIVMKACEYHPQDRYQHAKEMKEALLGLLETEKDKVLVTKPEEKKQKPKKVKKQEQKPKEEEVEEIEKTILLDREELVSESGQKAPKVETDGRRQKIKIGMGVGLALIIGVGGMTLMSQPKEAMKEPVSNEVTHEDQQSSQSAAKENQIKSQEVTNKAISQESQVTNDEAKNEINKETNNKENNKEQAEKLDLKQQSDQPIAQNAGKVQQTAPVTKESTKESAKEATKEVTKQTDKATQASTPQATKSATTTQTKKTNEKVNTTSKPAQTTPKKQTESNKKTTQQTTKPVASTPSKSQTQSEAKKQTESKAAHTPTNAPSEASSTAPETTQQPTNSSDKPPEIYIDFED